MLGIFSSGEAEEKLEFLISPHLLKGTKPNVTLLGPVQAKACGWELPSLQSATLGSQSAFTECRRAETPDTAETCHLHRAAKGMAVF